MPDRKAAPASEHRQSGGDDAASLQQLLRTLDGLNFFELRQIADAAEAKIREKAEEEKRALKEEVERRAAVLGISIRDLFGETPQPAKRGGGKTAKRLDGNVVEPKYRGPNGELWSGRGRMPKWMQAAEAAGKKKDDFLIGLGRQSPTDA